MAEDKACLQKRKLKHPPHSSQQEPFAQGDRARRLWTKKPGTSHSVPLLFLALLLCITKHGSCKRVGVEWLDFGAKAPLVVFLLPCSLFAPSPHLTTPWANTLGYVVWILQSRFHLTQRIWVLLSTIIWSPLLSRLVTWKRETDRVRGKGGKEKRGEG